MTIEIDLDDLPDDVRSYISNKARNTGIHVSRIMAQYTEDAVRRELNKVVPIKPVPEEEAYWPGD